MSIVQSNAEEAIDHQESTSLGEPHSIDIVLDIMLTTQEPHLDDQEVHVGAHSNDIFTNTRVS